MESFLKTERLLESGPFEFTTESRGLFLESFREMASHHFDASPEFRSFWNQIGLTPQDIESEEDLVRAPAMMVTLFKEWDLCSVSRQDIVLRLTSSGTGGQKSQMLLNEGSLRRVKKMAWNIHKALGITSSDKVNYVCFTYDPRVAKDLGTAFTDELLTSFTGIQSVYYAFQWNTQKNEFEFNEQGLIQRLRECQKEGLPVRLLGFPAFIYKVIKENNLQFNFGAHSWVQTGGGWKGLADQEIPKVEFRQYISEKLGVPISNIRDLLGMVEHGIPYVDCERGNLHVPNYARVFVRSPFDLKPLANGEQGLLQLLCTYNDSYPAMNILTTDWGRLGRCDCSLGGATIQITGRAGVSKHKGCAIQALEDFK